jgi:hypothetical protein
MRDHENHEKFMKKSLMKLENKKAIGIKFMNKYKYLGLNLQNTWRLTAYIDSFKIKLKKITKMIFFLVKKSLSP